MPDDQQPKEIVIKIKTKNIKQILYFSIPIILAVLLVLQFFFPISCPVCDCQNITIETEEVQLEPEIIPEPVTLPEPEVEEEEIIAEEEPEETTEEETDDGPTIAVTGDLYFKIDDITYEIKGEDWAKVTKIKYTISNAMSIDFIPKIEIYCYDDNDPDDIKNYIEETLILSELKSGYEITETATVSISFNEIDEEKELKLILRDQDDDTLKTIKKQFTISS